MTSRPKTAAQQELNMDLIPLCTEDSGGELVLNKDILAMLAVEELALRRVALVAVFELKAPTTDIPANAEKGLFIVRDPIKEDEDGNLTYLLVLRNVDLDQKPQWGTLALLLASHVIFIRDGHVHSEGFHNLKFISNLLEVQTLSGEDADPELNARVLKQHLPKLTYLVVDLDKKDCGGDSFSVYFNKSLANPSGNYDYSTVMLLQNLFPHRECIGIKSSMYKVPNNPYTAAKIISTATDENIPFKQFFGRFLCCRVFANIVEAIAPILYNQSAPLNLRHVVFEASRTYWKELSDSVVGTYADWMHAKILPYEPVVVDSNFVVNLTEINLGIKQDDDAFHVIDHGQGDHSVFDEYGNLKKNVPKVNPAPTDPSSLDVGILHFLKQKKRPGMLQRQATGAVPRSAIQDSDDDLIFEPYFEKMRAYEVPVNYIQNQAREKMPIDRRVLERRHDECISLAQKNLDPFLSLSIPGQDECFSGEWSLAKAYENAELSVASVKNEFESANMAASAAFCTKLIRYLHRVVLEKTHADDTESASSQSKVMIFLIAYRSNIEALVSQYNFLAKGPAAWSILSSFLHAVVPAQLLRAAQAAQRTAEAQENKVVEAIRAGKESLVELNKSLAESNRLRTDCMRREMDNQRSVDERKADQMRMIESSILETQQQIDRALREKEALFAKTVETTQATVATVEIIAKKPKEHSGYLFRQEGSGLLGKKWKQSFFVLKEGRFLCFKAKSYYEEGRESMEPPINVSGYTVLESRNHANEFKLAPPTAGRTFCFRAPSDDDKETWVQKFNEASNF